PCVYAEGQGGEKETPAYTPISKKELLSHFERRQVVKGRVITGADLIAVIRDTEVKIQIDHSVIEGGLDFTELPPITVDKVPLPQDWSDKQKEEWKAQYSGLPGIPVVKNEIRIINTEIRPEQPGQGSHSVAVDAKNTFFRKAASFSHTTLSGEADFDS